MRQKFAKLSQESLSDKGGTEPITTFEQCLSWHCPLGWCNNRPAELSNRTACNSRLKRGPHNPQIHNQGDEGEPAQHGKFAIDGEQYPP